ncbi:DUF4870 domain-containing protein [Leifsonia sp. A12D58]|uniref:DUF4870 domain-containing protein n=1 Tax=Leifsonia sp. A12D58 TaxID=3397674 RepID=UPI0039E07516
MTDPHAQTPPDPSDGAGQRDANPQAARDYGQPPSTPPAPLSAMDDKQWASFAHLGGILGFLPSLIIWLVFRDRGSFTNVEAKEALNFQITLGIGYVVIYIATFVLGVITFGLLSFLSNLIWVLWIIGVVFSILGFMKAKDGFHYRYPFAIRFIS